MNAVSKMLFKESKIPQEFLNLLKNEFRTVPVEFVEYFLEENGRLPSMEELQYAM